MSKREVVLCISDQHFPFNHPKIFTFLHELKNEYKPTQIVNLGDELDLYRLSRFDQDPDALGSNEEITTALLRMKELYAIFPNVKSCISNHTARFSRMAFKANLPSLFIRTVKEWMKAPDGWNWADYWEIDNVRYFHGEPYTSNTWMNAVDKYRQSIVIGHVHSRGGVIYSKAPNGVQLFAANSGCLINQEAYAFHYGKNTPSKPTIGTSVILDNGKRAEFIPLF